MKPKGGPKSKFKVTECTFQKSFTTQSSLPLAKMDFVHSLEERDEKLFLTHSIVFSGLLGFLFAKLLGRKLATGLPDGMSNLVKIAGVSGENL